MQVLSSVYWSLFIQIGKASMETKTQSLNPTRLLRALSWKSKDPTCLLRALSWKSEEQRNQTQKFLQLKKQVKGTWLLSSKWKLFYCLAMHLSHWTTGFSGVRTRASIYEWSPVAGLPNPQENSWTNVCFLVVQS